MEPSYADGWVNVGRARLTEGDLDGAERCFREGMRVFAENEDRGRLCEAERALTKLSEVVHRFDDEQQPYIPLVLSMWKNRYGSYDHLARVKEWAVPGEEEDAPGAPQ